jgi:FkbM family methyltransferase
MIPFHRIGTGPAPDWVVEHLRALDDLVQALAAQAPGLLRETRRALRRSPAAGARDALALARMLLQVAGPAAEPFLDRLQGRSIALPTPAGPVAADLGDWTTYAQVDECDLGDLFRLLLEPGQVVLDIGAHNGSHALQFSRCVGPAGRVYAFEPNPDNLPLLRATLAMNRIQDRVVLCPVALAEHSGHRRFFGYEADRDGCRRFPGRSGMLFSMIPGGGFQRPSAALVPTLSLDQWSRARPGLKADLVKVDTEGAEWGILRGAAEFLRTLPEVLLFIELHEAELERQGTSPHALRALLAEAGFTVFAVLRTPEGFRLRAWKAGMPFQGFYHILGVRDPGRMQASWLLPA